MENIYHIIKESTSNGFWHFIGCYLILTTIIYLPLKTFAVVINRILRHLNIRKHGYPPSRCDADGDFKKNK